MFLIIDQGTTSTKVILFDLSGNKIDSSQKSFEQIFPNNGWVEHNPEEIIKTVITCCNEVIENNSDKNICSIGITNQRETIVLWDKITGKSLYNAIVWQDRRTENFCRDLKEEGYEELIINKTGLLLDPYFSSTKISWIINNIDGVKEAINEDKVCAGTIDSWIIWNLTKGKVFATDITNAARTNLFNIKDLKWDDDLLNLFQVNKSILPEVLESDAFYGQSEALIKELPIYGVIGDQQSAAIGQKCFDFGDIKSTYGTGCFILLNTGKNIAYSKNGLLSTVAYKINGEITYALEGSIFMAGAIIDWLKNSLQVFDNYSELENILNNNSINTEVVMIPAFTGLGAPHWKPNSRASISGLTRDSNKNDIITSSVQSISLQTHDLIKAINEDTSNLFENPINSIKVDGGVTENDWFIQNLSDICDIKISKSNEQEATALGAASLSALGSKEIKNLGEFNIKMHENIEFLPKIEKKIREEIIENWNLALNKTIGV
ncbi:MAG: glycerol kinase [Rhodobiaceae bacterium]|jgi:glycerol kinase|nr:glycerol kinase [Rhodobiaceae bacterium]